jgi:tetratricopeptide (TPR) repeat protein
VRYGQIQGAQANGMRSRIERILDRAAEMGPSAGMQMLRLADAYFAIEQLDKAEPFYRELLEEHPDLQDARRRLAEIYLRSGHKDKASEQLAAVARNEPTNPQAYLVLGALAAEKEKYAEAAENFERAIRLEPDLEDVYYDLAGLKLMLKKPEEAREVLDKARARFRLSFPMEFYTALAYNALKNYPEALKYLISAEAIAKAREPNRLNFLFYHQMGSTQERAGHFEESEKYFAEALKLSPDDAETLNYLGYMWAERGVKLDEARRYIEKAVEQQPENAAFLDSQAWVLYKLNRADEALPPMLKALAHTPEPDATLYDHLGDIYSALRQHEKATEAYGKALQLEPNDKIQEKLKAITVPSPSP